jgi:hypothetical protein
MIDSRISVASPNSDARGIIPIMKSIVVTEEEMLMVIVDHEQEDDKGVSMFINKVRNTECFLCGKMCQNYSIYCYACDIRCVN